MAVITSQLARDSVSELERAVLTYHHADDGDQEDDLHQPVEDEE